MSSEEKINSGEKSFKEIYQIVETDTDGNVVCDINNENKEIISKYVEITNNGDVISGNYNLELVGKEREFVRVDR